MKKLVSMFLVLLIISTNVLAFASIDDKLINHWSKSIIEKDFVAYYFPYLAKDKFNKFNPEDNISKKDFTLSLASLFKDYGLDDITNNIGIYEPLTRKELVEIVGSKLISIDTIKYENQELPFQDINTMNKDSIELLRVLFNLKIINGVSSINFAPDRKVTQAEAIIILQRLKGVLEDMKGLKEISFNIAGIAQSYSGEEAIVVKEGTDNVLVTITKELPTPGYSLDVDKILRHKDGYKIYLNIIPPKADSMQLQVITYKTMTIEIDKNKLIGTPYIFTIEGSKSNLSIK
ncbi:hypothetical protein SAMN02745784_01906 [Tissierella praeacuta DSM 18095]|uniref:SLH domain-containing protein n=2 Tax=Tissierella praeacuta TaxID=43131 RepID=A0A1M4WKP6_9FIRM|nr:protease complex subunit PrcB family protein [Tissierella praeacuta]TCU79111.1 S-layer family protein [Tissierella praeacuta]SHE81786.1 hypothetical protein SAMN02745784_01906 [Tissierella praeacuta DSM 18095]SUO99342.1 Uncharacterised protein [Tissierella praeacuta]